MTHLIDSLNGSRQNNRVSDARLTGKSGQRYYYDCFAALIKGVIILIITGCFYSLSD